MEHLQYLAMIQSYTAIGLGCGNVGQPLGTVVSVDADAVIDVESVFCGANASGLR